MQIPFVIATNKARSSAVNGTRLVNCYAESQPQDSKNQVVLYGTPGTKRLYSLNGWSVLQMIKSGDYVYGVTEQVMFRIDKFGNIDAIGVVVLGGNVDMASNGTDIVAVDGTNGYYYNEKSGNVRPLTGGGWYPANSVTYQDGYFIFNRKDTGQFFISDLLSTNFDPLNFATAEGAPDNTLKVMSDHRELWVWGERTTEVWYNSGNPDFPFERMQGAFIEKGIAAPDTAAKLDNTVFWVGHDRIVYRASGYNPQRISNHAVEYDIATADLSASFAYTYIDEGHSFYVLTIPEIKKTWVFDVSTGLWHERSDLKLGYHSVKCHCYAFNKHFVGRTDVAQVHEMSLSYGTDNGQEIQRLMQSATVHAARRRAQMYSFEIDMENGVGLATGQGRDPQAMLQWSDDGGKTWSNKHWVGIGKIGEYKKRAIWRRLGQFRQRQMRVIISDPVPVVIIAAFAEVRGGRS